jgi:hypothetical protein
MPNIFFAINLTAFEEIGKAEESKTLEPLRREGRKGMTR